MQNQVIILGIFWGTEEGGADVWMTAVNCYTITTVDKHPKN